MLHGVQAAQQVSEPRGLVVVHRALEQLGAGALAVDELGAQDRATGQEQIDPRTFGISITKTFH